MKFTQRFSLFLIPTIWRSVFSLLVLPFTTYKLDAADFGAFALVTAISAFLTGIATGGTGYALQAHYRTAKDDERRSLISTLILWSLLVSIGLAAAMVAVWSSVIFWLGDGEPMPPAAVWYGAAHVVLGVPWILAVTVGTIQGRAVGYAAVSLAEATLGPLATLLVLYGYNAGGISLFVGNVVSTAITTIGAVVILRRDLRIRISRSVTLDYFRHLVMSVPAQLIERIRVVAERIMLARYTGLQTVGIYVHSQQYSTLGRFGVKAFSNAMWSVTLAEAQSGDPRFTKTGQGWVVAQFGVALIGILFAAFGQDFIALLTHGKFTEAYVFAAVWMILILLENTGRPMTAMLLAHKRVAASQKLAFISGGAGLGALLVATPFWGAWGLIAAAFVQSVTYRLGLVLLALRQPEIPFQDHVALIGMAVNGATIAVILWFNPDLPGRIGIFLLAVGLLVALCATRLADIWRTARQVLAGRNPG